MTVTNAYLASFKMWTSAPIPRRMLDNRLGKENLMPKVLHVRSESVASLIRLVDTGADKRRKGKSTTMKGSFLQFIPFGGRSAATCSLAEGGMFLSVVSEIGSFVTRVGE